MPDVPRHSILTVVCGPHSSFFSGFPGGNNCRNLNCAGQTQTSGKSIVALPQPQVLPCRICKCLLALAFLFSQICRVLQSLLVCIYLWTVLSSCQIYPLELLDPYLLPFLYGCFSSCSETALRIFGWIHVTLTLIS